MWVNFQHYLNLAVGGYYWDIGSPYDIRESQGRHLFGWNHDLSVTGTDREMVADQRFDTFLRPLPGDEWKVAVPNNRSYSVFIVAGDPNVIPGSVIDLRVNSTRW